MRKKLIYSGFAIIGTIFLLMNILAYNHTYHFTHYSPPGRIKVHDDDFNKISFLTKIKYIISGVEVPRPSKKVTPDYQHKIKLIKSGVHQLEICESTLSWSRGTVIMFPGYAANKSALIGRSEAFVDMQYNVVLVDFAGTGGSDGHTCNLGFREAKQVYDCYNYVKEKSDSNIYLYGISMGAVAIMKAIKDYHPELKGIFLECPFATLRQTTVKRFKNYRMPTFPMVDLMMLWGAYHGGFWTYDHNPASYAKEITCPTLLLYGKKDHAVTLEEIEHIYQNLAGPKTLKVFPRGNHNVIRKSWKKWKKVVDEFLTETNPLHPANGYDSEPYFPYVQ